MQPGCSRRAVRRGGSTGRAAGSAGVARLDAATVSQEGARQTVFAGRLIDWQRRHGRRDLPWQRTRDPYRVWLAEVMLQQTRVATVAGYYERFLLRFPDLAALAAAEPGEVMALWAGLGYYARARNLHACARAVMAEHGGAFPRSARSLARLPGIGRSTAAAIAAFCFHERAAILDGNVKRVLARVFAIEGHPAAAAVERRLWALAQRLLPARGADMPRYTQALMDLGATLCTRHAPCCLRCPLRTQCVAHAEGRVDALPTPRPARVARLRQTHWLLLRWNGSVMLESRPPSGLWGGLLAPPQFDTRGALNAAARRFARRPAPRTLPARRHSFTHFTLEFTPHLLELRAAPPVAAELAAVWLPAAAVQRAALPAPVRALLVELQGAREATDTAGRRRSRAQR